MYCKNCGQQLNENQAICLNCGVSVENGTKYCHNCGNELPENADFCINCGVATKKKASVNLGGQDKITMAIICFFLGGLGIHNFMMGESKKGITKIVASFCCGIGEILALIDFIKILTDNYIVDADKLI
jgi:TM2 domain-containing membrane protein YozV